MSCVLIRAEYFNTQGREHRPSSIKTMNARDINRDNLSAAIDETLDECIAQIDGARDQYLVEDLRIAIDALRGIKAELEGIVAQRPKGLRTGLFIRYALDASDQLAMDAMLKEKVVRIEDIYKRL
jgi:hypothetical protein